MVKFKKILIVMMLFFSVSFITVMANEDAGGKLQSWYDNLLQQSQKSITDDASIYSESLLLGFQEAYMRKTSDAEAEISKAAEYEKNRANAQIFYYNGNYLGQLWDKRDQLLYGQITADFDAYVNGKKTDISSYLNDEANLFLQEVENQLNGIVTDTEETLLDKKNEAVDKLDSRISAVKENLSNQLEERKDQATEYLNDYVDGKIFTELENIQSKIQASEAEQKSSITTIGEEIEEDAKSEMELVVGKIKN